MSRWGLAILVPVEVDHTGLMEGGFGDGHVADGCPFPEGVVGQGLSDR